jgi:hypothetical protein
VGFKVLFQLRSKNQPCNIKSPHPQHVPQSRTQGSFWEEPGVTRKDNLTREL